MAAIFQIRRGTSNVSLTDGELYLHQTSGSLQIGSGSSVVTMAKLNEPNVGNFNVTGDITIGGTITIGDTTSDSVVFNADLSSSIIPDSGSTYDLGASNRTYRNIYGNAVWGAISASNGVISGSAQFISVLSSLNDFTSSQNTKNSTLAVYTASIDSKFTTLQSLTASNSNRLNRLEESTSSLNAFSASQNTKDSTLQTYTASIDAKFTTLQSLTASNSNRFTRIEESTASLNSYTSSTSNRLSRLEESTASLNIFSASVNEHISDINTKTGSFETKWLTLQNVTSSILSYTQSLKDAITVAGVGAASTTTIKGNLYVQGTQTVVDSTTLNIADNVIALSAAGTNDGGLVVRDSTGASTTSGSLLWDVTTDYWKVGKLNSESQILTAGGMDVMSGSLLSLNTFSASTLGHISDINTKTGSFETKFSTLGLYTASLDVKNSTLQTLTASVQSQISRLQESTASLNLFTASQETKNSTLQTLTASMAAQVSRLQESTASLNLFTASQETKNSTIASYTASVSGHIVDINTKTGSFENKFTLIQSVTASFNTATASLNTFSASINGHVADINIWTSSVNTKFTTLQSVTASLNNATASLFISSSQLTASFTQLRSDFLTLQTSVDPNSISGHLTNINAWTSSIHLYTASINGHIADINIKTGSFETKFTTLSTLTGSNAIRLTNLESTTASLNISVSNLNAASSSYETKGRGIVSGSSQILGGSGVWSGSAQMPVGVVSGSSQVSGSIFTTISGDIAITTNGVATIQANSVALGVDTTGNYMSDLTQGTGVTISHTPGEGSNATISIAQAVATTSNVQFGSIGVGGAASGASGEIRAWGDITAYYSSDERLKENIQPIVNALSKIELITGNTYDWKEGFEEIHSHKGSDLGIIAQEVQSVLPEVVTERDNGYLAVDYIKLVPVLIEAIKELSAKVKDLENK